MTVQAQDSVYAQVFVPRDYDVFAGLDVNHHSIAATFTDHDRLMQSLRLPYSAGQLLNYVRKHFPQQRVAFVYEAGPTGLGLYDELAAAGQARPGGAISFNLRLDQSSCETRDPRSGPRFVGHR